MSRAAVIKELEILRELKTRDAEPIFAYTPCSHKERDQLRFHKSPAMVRLLTGGNQSGKSLAAAAEVAYHLLGCHPHQATAPNPRVFCLSAVYRTVQEGIWRHLNPASRELGGGAGFIPRERILKTGPKIPGYDIPSYLEVLPFGTSCKDKYGNKASSKLGRIDFLSAEGGQSARRRVQAAAIDLFSIDEEVEEILWEEIKMRLLVRGGKVTLSATMVQSEQWMIDIETKGKEGFKGYDLIRLNTDYNEHIKSSVRDQVFAGMSDEEQRIRRLGLSRASQGQVYPEFDGGHIVDPFPIPADWPRFMAMDPGFRTFAGLWAAINPKTGRTFIYREMYERNTNLDKVAEFVYRAENIAWDTLTGSPVIGAETEVMTTRWLDPAGFAHSVSGEIGVGITLAARYQLNTVPAQNSVMAGIETVRSWLKPGLGGTPMVQIFSNLTNFQAERRTYKFKENSPSSKNDSRPDRPIKKHDHLMDCWRYLAMGIIGPSQVTDSSFKSKADESRPSLEESLKFSYGLKSNFAKRAGALSEVDRDVAKFLHDRDRDREQEYDNDYRSGW